MSQEEDLIKVQNGVLSMKDYIEKYMNITQEQDDIIGDYDIVEKDMRKVLFDYTEDPPTGKLYNVEKDLITINKNYFSNLYKKAEEYNKLFNEYHTLNNEVCRFKRSFWYKIYKLF